MLEILGWILLSIVCLILLMLITGAVWAKFITVGEYYDETHYFQASDGWTLAIHRYIPEVKKFFEPVILCHGLGSNRFNFDLEELSLARYLRDIGFETFLVELRGVGYSAKKSLRARDRHKYRFDDFVDKDVPAIVNKVLAISRARKAFWVGHSMGGMIAYVAFADPEVAPKVAGAVAIASPAKLSHLKYVQKLYPKLGWMLAPFGVLHQNVVARMWLPFVGITATPWSSFLYNPENMSTKIIRQATAKMVTPMSRRLLSQLAQWVIKGEFKHGYRDYYTIMALNRVPFLLLASTADHMAPPDSVQLAYDKLGSSDKSIVCFGTSTNLTRFGHGDIVLSRKAKEQVYPLVAEWLEKRATLNKG